MGGWLRLGIAMLTMVLVGAEARYAPTTLERPSALDALPWSVRIGLERAMSAHQLVVIEEGAPVLDAGGVRARIDRRGAAITIGDRHATLRATAIGRGGMHALVAGTPTITGPEVRTDRGAGVSEWWRALPSGLEHGLTIAERPEGDGVLTIELGLEGALAPRAVGADAVALVDATGVEIASYAHLAVVDAAGVLVDARLGVQGGHIVIAVGDTGAQYPLVVDPLLVVAQEAELVASDGAVNDTFGRAVSLSADGSRALVGVRSAGAGAAYVFLRTGTSWTQEAELVAGGVAAGDLFGASVSLSSDGTRALVGAYGRNSATGAAYVFLRTGTSWTQEAQVLASDAATNDYFGLWVSLDSDGTRALVGAQGHASNSGAAYVFLRTGVTWTQEAQLRAADGATNDYFGVSVALSSDGTRALVGAYERSSNAGAAYVFLRTGTSWAQEAELFASDAAASDWFGSAVSLSADGTRALVGATARSSNTGAAYVFLRTGTSWAQAAELFASDAAPSDAFGWSVSLSPDGTRALVGADGRASNTGAAYVFTIASDPLGAACTVDAACLSRHCVDGVCCDTSCGGGNPADCEGCTAALTGGTDGTCAARPSSAICRAAAGACDVAETCDGTALTCPGDALRPLRTICRPAAGTCDVAEACDGVSVGCPVDGAAPALSVCRASAGVCDQQEVCDGVSVACPVDTFVSASVVCRPSVGVCDVAESCSGTSAACPTDAFASAGTVCNGTVVGVCDAPDVCNGMAAACPATYASGVVCRAAVGACDIAESCSGTTASCPPDALEGAGTVCRTSMDLTCDPLESCDGTSTSCPPDVNACTVMPDTGARDAGVIDAGRDAGSDAGSSRDAMASDALSSGVDAGVTPPPSAGNCGCRATRAGASRLGPLLLALLWVAGRRRSRRVP